MYCEYCGTENKAHALYCENCGSKLEQSEPVNREEEPVTAEVLEREKGINNTKFSSRGVLIAIIAAVLVAFGIGGYYLWNNYKATEVDLMQIMTPIEYIGYNGEGYVGNEMWADEDITLDNEYRPGATEDFFYSIYYTATPSENLSNGDKIKVVASYDKEAAKKLNIKVVNTEQTFEVEGLTEHFNEKSVKPEQMEELKALAQKYIRNNYGTEYKNFKTKYIGGYATVSDGSEDPTDEYVDDLLYENTQISLLYKLDYEKENPWNGEMDKYTDYVEVFTVDYVDEYTDYSSISLDMIDYYDVDSESQAIDNFKYDVGYKDRFVELD